MPCEKSCKTSAKPCKSSPALTGNYTRECAANQKKTGPAKKEWQVGRDNHGGRRRRRPGSHSGWCRRAEPAARPGGLRAALARGRAADPGGPALLLPPGPAAFQQGLRLQPAPHPRETQRLHPAAQRAEEARALPPAHLTEEQVAQRVRQQVEASLGDPGGPILQLLDETYFLNPEGHWVVSTQSTQYWNSRTKVETLLRRTSRSACPGSWPSCCS